MVMEQLPPARDSGGKVRHRWVCICICGTIKEVLDQALRCGQSLSCGCLQREVASDTFSTHKQSGTGEHRAWLGMKRRCYDPRNKQYSDYGGRGISVCPEWYWSFETFYADMGPKPSPLHSMERKDNSIGYQPDNCVWATRYEQARNKRSTRMFTINGRTQCLRDWIIEYGAKHATVHYHLKQGRVLQDVLEGRLLPCPAVVPLNNPHQTNVNVKA